MWRPADNIVTILVPERGEKTHHRQMENIVIHSLHLCLVVEDGCEPHSNYVCTTCHGKYIAAQFIKEVHPG